ncbi:MAG: hypothetical protein HYW24_02805 [Candidatus Aenigmarchaeota archaeon]|nr:hypothetical protein [Candidatus Aenigmarchaeota archaeon]
MKIYLIILSAGVVFLAGCTSTNYEQSETSIKSPSLNGTISNVIEGDYVVQETLYLSGILTGNVEVKQNGVFYLSGILNGNVDVDPQGTLYISGVMTGDITNDGGLVNITGIVVGNVITKSGDTFIDSSAIVRTGQEQTNEHITKTTTRNSK